MGEEIGGDGRGPALDYDEILGRVTADPRYQSNIAYGEVRDGHPEGSVAAHIGDLMKNLDRLRPYLTAVECSKLAFLVHVHDTFKAEAKKDVPIEHERSHATLARNFGARFTDDTDLLNILQFHDVNYLLWKQFKKTGAFDAGYLESILSAFSDVRLYIVFTLVDGAVPGKDLDKLKWFYSQARAITPQLSVEEHFFQALEGQASR